MHSNRSSAARPAWRSTAVLLLAAALLAFGAIESKQASAEAEPEAGNGTGAGTGAEGDAEEAVSDGLPELPSGDVQARGQGLPVYNPSGDGFDMYYTGRLATQVGLPKTNHNGEALIWEDALVVRKTDSGSTPPDSGYSGIAFTSKGSDGKENVMLGIRGYSVQVGTPQPAKDATFTVSGLPGRGRTMHVFGQGSWASTVLENRGTGQVLWLESPNGSGDYIVAASNRDVKFAVRANGQTDTKTLRILGGSDVAEGFDVSGMEPLPGMVLSIDPENEGKLAVSETPYDRRVAGVVSGAGGVSSGLMLAQPEVGLDGAHPVALSGRVKVLCDATSEPIVAGDLLTTSDRPGHCMKVTDHGLAPGAVIGKAMGSLDAETGLVLALINLQ